jgi:alkylation response protein AidB-like acyl-CoA dehydrogenase
VFTPRSEVEVIDTWYAGGLKGTGSHDYAVKDAVVPESRTCSFNEPPREQGTLYHMPAIPTFGALIASVPLGIARHAIDAMIELANVKVPTRSTELLKAKSPAQVQLGEAEGLLRAAKALHRQALTGVWEHVKQTGRTNWADRGNLWLANTQAARLACQAVDLMFLAGGATSPYASAGLERCLRDIRVASQHITTASTNFELVGQQLLGVDPVQTVWAFDERGDY